MTFDELHDHYTAYIIRVASRCQKAGPFTDADDLAQILRIKLWHLHMRYANIALDAFHRYVVVSFANVLASLFRMKKAQESGFLHLEQDFPSDRAMDSAQPARNDVSEEFYRSGINAILDTCSPKTAEIIMDALTPEEWRDGRGRWRAAREVRQILGTQ